MTGATKTQILDKIWDINFDPGSNIVEVHMYQLRKKIDNDNTEPLIQTVIGRGRQQGIYVEGLGLT